MRNRELDPCSNALVRGRHYLGGPAHTPYLRLVTDRSLPSRSRSAAGPGDRQRGVVKREDGATDQDLARNGLGTTPYPRESESSHRRNSQLMAVSCAHQ